MNQLSIFTIGFMLGLLFGVILGLLVRRADDRDDSA